MDRCTLLGALEPVLRNGYGTHTFCNPTVLTRLREIGRNLSIFGQTWRTAPGEGRTLLLWGRQSHNVKWIVPVAASRGLPQFCGICSLQAHAGRTWACRKPSC